MGIFVGAILAIIILGVFKARRDYGFTYFANPKETITYINSTGEKEPVKSFRVIGTIENGMAIAVCPQVHSYELIVLLSNDNGEVYYDNQIVDAPKEKVFKQIGVYKTNSKNGLEVVPVVKIADAPPKIKPLKPINKSMN